jgi:hypothetical protein
MSTTTMIVEMKKQIEIFSPTMSNRFDEIDQRELHQSQHPPKQHQAWMPQGGRRR